MSKNKTGAGSLLFHLVLSILLVFTLLGTLGGALGRYVTASPSLLISQLEKQNAPQKAHDALQSKFDMEYNTTAVPAEVYMDVITVAWMEDAMEQWITDSYARANGADLLTEWDFIPLEESITTYFEQYAEENNCEKDDTYTEKLSETIANAEKAVKNAVDVYHIQTMKDAGIWEKVFDHRILLTLLAAVCGVLSLALAGLLVFRKDRPCYWIGTSLFAGGVLLTIPAAWVLGSSIITQFSLKEPAVYAVFTGTMTTLVQIVLTIGIVLLAAGLVCIIGSMRRNKIVS